MSTRFNGSFKYKCKLALQQVAAFTFVLGAGIAGAECIKQYINDDTYIIEENNDKDLSSFELEDNKAPLIENIQNIREPIILEDTRKVAALTFDDGPGKYTDRLLDILESNDITATFFVLGSNVNKYKYTVKRAYDLKNEIAIHGYTHTYYTDLGLEETQKEITDTYNLLRDINVEPSRLVRPPGMKYNEELVENLNYPFILWSIDTRDWESKDKDKIKEEILNNIEEGSIILLHDINASSVDAIEEILPDLTEEYRFVTVSDLFDILENDLDTCKVYNKVKVLK